MPGGTGAFGGETGSPGVFRLFGKEMAGQNSWLLPLAILGFFATALILWKKKDDRTKARLRSVCFWGAWMLPMLAYFSISGFFHRYYLIMLAPSIAALCGIGLTTMWSEYYSRGRKWYLLPLSLVVTALAQLLFIIRYPELSYWLIPVTCAFTVTSAAVLLYARSDDSGVFKGVVKPLAICGMAALLIAPAAWSVTPILYGSQTTLPYAGPELSQSGFPGDGNTNRSGMGMGFPGMADMGTNGLTEFLIEHMGSERFIVAVPSSMTASSIILETGLPVMAVGGFGGGDPILTSDRLEKMVAGGEIRYYLTMGMSGFSMPAGGNIPSGNSTGNGFFSGGSSASRSAMPGMMGGSQSEINDWVQTHGTVVPASEWMGDKAINVSDGDGFDGPSSGFVLYDLKGSA